jgi:hypothetical protein
MTVQTEKKEIKREGEEEVIGRAMMTPWADP